MYRTSWCGGSYVSLSLSWRGVHCLLTRTKVHHQQSSEETSKESNDYRVTMKVMITLIVIAAPVDMVAEIISMEKIIMAYEPK